MMSFKNEQNLVTKLVVSPKDTTLINMVNIASYSENLIVGLIV